MTGSQEGCGSQLRQKVETLQIFRNKEYIIGIRYFTIMGKSRGVKALNEELQEKVASPCSTTCPDRKEPAGSPCEAQNREAFRELPGPTWITVVC